MKFKYQAALAAIALALGSCASDAMFDDGTGTTGKTGLNKPGVEVNNAEKVIKNAPSRAAYDVSNFLLDFYRDGEAEPFMSKKYNELAATIDLPAGDYTIGVRSHEVKDAEWENPYFVGTSEKFTIESEKITTVNPISCKFASIKVTVKFGDKLREQLGDNVKVTVIVGQGQLIYTPADENRGGYFAPLEGSTTMVVTFTGLVDGREETATRTYADIAAGQHREITFNAGGELLSPDEPKGTMDVGGISVSFDYTDEDIDGAVDPGKEEVINDGEAEPGQKPEIPDPDDPNQGGNENPDPIVPDVPDDTIVFGGSLQNGKTYYNDELSEYTISVDTEEPITDFDVVINSTALTPEELTRVGLSDKFSLAYPGEFTDGITSLDFPCGDGTTVRYDGDLALPVLGAKHVDLSVTSFMGLLSGLGSSTSNFTMTVKAGGVTKVLNFTILVK